MARQVFRRTDRAARTFWYEPADGMEMGRPLAVGGRLGNGGPEFPTAHCPSQIAVSTTAEIEVLRRKRMTGGQIADRLGVSRPPFTVSFSDDGSPVWPPSIRRRQRNGMNMPHLTRCCIWISRNSAALAALGIVSAEIDEAVFQGSDGNSSTWPSTTIPGLLFPGL